MTPHELLAHSDGGQPWPAGAEPATDMAAAYRQALAMRVLRLTRGEREAAGAPGGRGWEAHEGAARRAAGTR